MRRILVRTAATLFAIVLVFAAFVFARSELALRKVWNVGEASLTIPAGDDAVARGEHLAITRGCTDCHGADLGGHVMMEVPAIGRMAGPNLTHGPGGLPSGFGDADFERAIRHGVKPDGHAILFMPTRDFAALSDADTADLIAYVKSRPPVDRSLAPSYIGPIGRTLFALGQLPMLEARLIDQHAAHVARIENAATVEFGDYLARACTGCHGQHFSGRADSRRAARFSDSGEYHAGWGDWHRCLHQRRLLSRVSRRQEARWDCGEYVHAVAGDGTVHRYGA